MLLSPLRHQWYCPLAASSDAPQWRTGGSWCSPTVSGLSRRSNRLLVEIGRTDLSDALGHGQLRFRVEPLRPCGLCKCCPSCARCCSSSITVSLRGSSPTPVHPGTCPDRLGDRGDRLLRFQVGKPRKPSRDHAAPGPIRKDRLAGVLCRRVVSWSPGSAYSLAERDQLRLSFAGHNRKPGRANI